MLRKDSLLRQVGSRGFTLVELVIVVAIVGVLATVAVPYFEDIKDNMRVTSAVAEISGVRTHIDAYHIGNSVLPATLNDILTIDALTDPYGNPYQYLVIATAPGTERKDKWTFPLNSSYDLFSKGKDGVTSQLLDDPKSLDDIVHATDGAYLGLGSEF